MLLPTVTVVTNYTTFASYGSYFPKRGKFKCINIVFIWYVYIVCQESRRVDVIECVEAYLFFNLKEMLRLRFQMERILTLC